MSLITQCPACSTLFKVVPDQLRISDGWVRCGQCDEVFDANANIRADVPVSEGSTVSTTSHSADGAAETAVTANGSAYQPDAEMQALDPSDDVSAPAADTAAISPSLDIPLHDALTTVHADHFFDKSPKELSDFSEAVSAASVCDEILADTPVPDVAPERRYMQMFAPDTKVHEDPKLSFMQPAGAPSVWARRGVRVTLGVGCALLTVSAVLQVLVHERDRLVAQHPEFHVELVSLCATLGCEVQPLRQIESVVIDSSAFSKVRNEVYKLSFTLRNTSAMALATPAMELTLTDMQDQILMRKVLAPGDFATVPAVMNAGVEVSATLPLSVRLSVERVSGYRLLAFYP